MECLLNLNCALATHDDEHVCEEPIMLSCGDYICKSCFECGSKSKEIRCNHCDEINVRDLSQKLNPKSFNILLHDNLDTLFKFTYEKFKTKIDLYKDLIYNGDEYIDLQIEYVKDQIDIRIESLKIDLDNFRDSFFNQVNELKEKWKVEDRNIYIKNLDEKIYENELIELENSIKEHQNMSKEHLYHYQNKLKSVQTMIAELKQKMPKLAFTEGKLKLEKGMIGELSFNELDEINLKIINRIKENKYQKSKFDVNGYDFCVLPNGQFLFTSYYNLLSCDEKMNVTQTVTKIDNKPFNISAVATDGVNSLFLSDEGSHSVLKTDLEFNLLAKLHNGQGNRTNQFSYPRGLCYYNEHVFVCDYNNLRVQKLASNLAFKQSYQLSYKPFYLKNIDNIAINRPNLEDSIYFYDLNNFNLLRKYDGHSGVIGASHSCFFEHYPKSNRLYCYNKNGELIESIQTNNWDSSAQNSWGSLCIFNTKLYIMHYHNKFLIVI